MGCEIFHYDKNTVVLLSSRITFTMLKLNRPIMYFSLAKQIRNKKCSNNYFNLPRIIFIFENRPLSLSYLFLGLKHKYNQRSSHFKVYLPCNYFFIGPDHLVIYFRTAKNICSQK